MNKCEQIKEYLTKHGIKQSWCAEVSQIDYGRFRKLMTNRVFLRADEADRINSALGTHF